MGSYLSSAVIYKALDFSQRWSRLGHASAARIRVNAKPTPTAPKINSSQQNEQQNNLVQWIFMVNPNSALRDVLRSVCNHLGT